MTPLLVDLREGAMLVEFPDRTDEEANRAAVALGGRLRENGNVEDAIPAARSLLVIYDPFRTERELVAAAIARSASPPAGAEEKSRLVRLPIVYDGEDVAELAQRSGLPPPELARRHAAGRYRVAFVGFAPGFAYLSGLSAELASPRRTSPRPRVPAGSVAIGGAWTGVYPSASPGGWRLIGRTSAVLFDTAANPPSLLAPGDHVEFEAVNELPAPRRSVDAAAPAGRPAFRVLSPGLFTSIQGAPRHGLGSSGVPPGGAMDPRGLAAANAEVGNRRDALALEITFAGPELEILENAVMSSRGLLRSGERVRFGRVERGAREYVAVAGGFVDPRPAAEPTRRLEAGDLLYTGLPGAAASTSGHPASFPSAELFDEIPLRVVLGPEAAGFASEQVRRFLAGPWRVTPESDRRGLRLAGEPLEHVGSPEIAPSGTVPGTVQIPGSGLPIVLGPDGPVTGGYPRLATVIGADLWRLGQARPGATLRFSEITFREATALTRSARSTITLP